MITLSRNTGLVIIGAGLVGSLLSIYLARRGFHLDVFEKCSDWRKTNSQVDGASNVLISRART